MSEKTVQERSRPDWLPQSRQFANKDFNTVQRPEGLEGPGLQPVEPRDVQNHEVERYSGIQITPGRTDEAAAYTAPGSLGPTQVAGGDTILLDKDLGFPAASILVDNWTNQWIYFPDLRRFVPPYSGGWVFSTFKQTQKMKAMLKAPSASFLPAAALAGEYVWFGFMEAFMPPQAGIITTVKTPVVA